MFGKENIPKNEDEYSGLLLEHFYIFENLQQIILKNENHGTCGSYMMGPYNVQYEACMYPKQKLIFDKAKNKKKIIEIGVNAGHSLLIMLLANPNANYDVIDICEKSYTIPCVEYLQSIFPNRITFYKGDSLEVLKSFQDNQKDYDFWHIDGYHEHNHIIKEISYLKSISEDKPLIVLDDVFPNDSPVTFVRESYKEFNHNIIHPSCRWPNTVIEIY